MMILPTNSVERLDVRPVVPATLRTRTLPTRPHNTGIVPPWLADGSVSTRQAATSALVHRNTGIVPPWLLDGSELLPTQKIQK